MTSERASVNGQDSGPPTHRDVADRLRDRIKSGQLQPGERMPTQAKLAEEFGVERGAVRQALRILQSEHLLTNVSKGSPATVAPDLGKAVTGPGAEPQATRVALGSRIAEAFEASHVTIDALCLASRSLTLAMGVPLHRIHSEQVKPAKIDVRVLMPSGDIDLAFPAPVAAASDDRFQRRWLTQRNAQAQVLQHNLLSLRATHGIDVNVSFRALPFTPPVKLYLLNGAEALFAYYTLTEREEEIDHEPLQMYAAGGTKSPLFTFARGGGVRDAMFVEQSQLWFSALWETISTELNLTS